MSKAVTLKKGVDRAETIRLTADGNAFCALIGEDPMEGRMGCGPTPSAALIDLAFQIEMNGWQSERGVLQTPKAQFLRLRFHPDDFETVKKKIGSLPGPLELTPDPASNLGTLTVEDRFSRRTLLELSLSNDIDSRELKAA